MQAIVATGTTKDSLICADSLVEVRDEKGIVIGFFAPVSLEHAPRYAEAAAALDPIMAKRASKEGPVRSTAEVHAYLSTLESR